MESHRCRKAADDVGEKQKYVHEVYNSNHINTCPIIIFPISFCLRLALVHYRIFVAEVQRDRVHTMPLIRRCRVPLALEHMPQMPSTVRAHDLRPLHAECAVHVPGHGAWNGVVEGGPSATRLELLLRGVEGRGAGGAGVGARRRSMLVVLAGVGRLGALLADDAELFCFDAPLVAVSVPVTSSGRPGETYRVTAEPATHWRSSRPGDSYLWFVLC